MNAFDRFCVASLDYVDLDSMEKTSSAARSAMEKLPDSEFGLVVVSGTLKSRRFPCYSEEALVKSAACLVSADEVLPPSMQKIAAKNLHRRYLEFGLEPPNGLKKLSGEQALRCSVDWSKVANEWETLEGYQQLQRMSREKLSSADMPVLHSWKIEGNPHEIVVRNLKDVRRAETYLKEHVAKLSSTDRRHMARQVLVSYQKLGFDTSDPRVLQKMSSVTIEYGGSRVRPEGKTILSDRLKAVDGGWGYVSETSAVEKVSSTYKSIIRELENVSSVEGVEKLASQVDQLDRLYGIDSRVMPAHKALFFSIGERQDEDLVKSSEDDDAYSFGQTFIREADIKKLPMVSLAPLEAFLGVDVVEELRKDPVGVFKSFPRPQQRMVAKFIEEVVISGGRNSIPALLS